jgi:hypothetical protein
MKRHVLGMLMCITFVNLSGAHLAGEAGPERYVDPSGIFEIDLPSVWTSGSGPMDSVLFTKIDVSLAVLIGAHGREADVEKILRDYETQLKRVARLERFGPTAFFERPINAGSYYIYVATDLKLESPDGLDQGYAVIGYVALPEGIVSFSSFYWHQSQLLEVIELVASMRKSVDQGR